VENYVLLLVLLSVFAGGTLVLLSLLLLFCHRCCMGGRRYSRCEDAPATRTQVLGLSAFVFQTNGGDSLPFRASDDLEKTNTTYAEDSQPNQGRGGVGTHPNTSPGAQAGLHPFPPSEITFHLDESDALSAASCRDGESERFVSAGYTGRRVSFNESALYEKEKATQGDKVRRYTLTEGDFHHLKKARLTHLHLPPAPCDLKILTIMECDSAGSSTHNVSEATPPNLPVTIYQPSERRVLDWAGPGLSGGLPGDTRHSTVLEPGPGQAALTPKRRSQTRAAHRVPPPVRWRPSATEERRRRRREAGLRRRGRPRSCISSPNCGAMPVWRGRGPTSRDGSLTAATGLLAWTLKWQRHKQYSDPGAGAGGRYSPSLERQRFTPLRRGDSAGYPLDTRYHSTLSRIASAADEEASEGAACEEAAQESLEDDGRASQGDAGGSAGTSGGARRRGSGLRSAQPPGSERPGGAGGPPGPEARQQEQQQQPGRAARGVSGAGAGPGGQAGGVGGGEALRTACGARERWSSCGCPPRPRLASVPVKGSTSSSVSDLPAVDDGPVMSSGAVPIPLPVRTELVSSSMSIRPPSPL
ncbi:unnamed protein product, partial [Tetraodon nigroviridis]